MHVLPAADDPDTTTPFAYTRRADRGRPELLIAGLPPEIAHGLLLRVAIARYGRDRIHLQQVVWPDPKGRLPWVSGCDVDPASSR